MTNSPKATRSSSAKRQAATASPQRRRTLQALGGLALALPGPILAQSSYPTKPVKWVLNFPPGGPSDLIARLLGER